MKNKKILSIGTMYLDINCLIFPFEKGLYKNREVVGNQYNLDLGGSALNFAKIAAQLQLETFFLGKTGDDKISEILLSLLHNKNINPLIVFDKYAQTNISIHYIHKNGSSIMSSCGDANQSITIKEIENKIFPILNSIDYLYLGGIFKLKNILPYLKDLLKKIKKKKVKIILDHGRVNNKVSSKDIKYLKNIFPYIDIYLPSIDEFLDVWGINLKEAMIEMRKISAPLTIIKKSKNGSVCFIDNKIISVKAFKINPINTVGAGDSFNAGFIKAYSEDMSIENSIKYASAVAAIKISDNNLNMNKIRKLYLSRS